METADQPFFRAMFLNSRQGAKRAKRFFDLASLGGCRWTENAKAFSLARSASWRFSFISAAVVNTFVPSGGGQWAVQGPIIADAANLLHVSHAKSVMALAYGDQITNMLQPFWALPLLGITRLTAQEILPYCIFMMLLGSAIVVSGLLLF